MGLGDPLSSDGISIFFFEEKKSPDEIGVTRQKPKITSYITNSSKLIIEFK